ncbi:MAG: FliH/SctL family protein [Gemmatimonadota bacterium]
MTSSPDAWTPVALSARLLPDLRRPAPGECEAGPETGEPEEPLPDPREEVYAQGYADGVAAGAAQARDELRPVVRALQDLMASFADQRAAILGDLERNVHAVAMGVARKILQREIAADPGAIVEMVRDALELVPMDQPLEIRLHPADHDVVRDALASYVPDRAMPVQWRPDATLDRGDFVLATPPRLVDGRADVALRTIYDWLNHE